MTIEEINKTASDYLKHCESRLDMLEVFALAKELLEQEPFMNKPCVAHQVCHQEKEDIVDHTCEEKQEQTRDEKLIDDIDFAIKATNSQDDYSMGMRNGMRYVKSLIDGKDPQYELSRTDDEIKLGIDLGDEVVDDYGSKGVVVGIDTYRGEVLLSLLMKNHKVPQLVEASSYKTKTGRHFDAIEKLYEEMEK